MCCITFNWQTCLNNLL